MIKRRIFLTIKGMGYLEGFGYSPAIPYLASAILLGARVNGILGACIMLSLFGPVFLVGCYDRAREWEDEQIEKHLKVLLND